MSSADEDGKKRLSKIVGAHARAAHRRGRMVEGERHREQGREQRAAESSREQQRAAESSREQQRAVESSREQ